MHKNVFKKNRLKKLISAVKPMLWFFVGVGFAGFCLTTFFLVYFRVAFKDHVIPGIYIGSYYAGEKTPEEVEKYFTEKNNEIQRSTITLTAENHIATVSARDINIGYDTELIKEQAESIGKSKNILSNAYYIIYSYLYGITLSPPIKADREKLTDILNPIQKEIYVEPINAEFHVENGKVANFSESENGKSIDFEKLDLLVDKKIPELIFLQEPSVTISVPIKITEPEITTEEANTYGIVEEIGVGTSEFAHSIPNRVHNVNLAASRLNGILVAPGEEFSFGKYLGDVSKFTGYKEAYVISGGKTILGDGGGVCQVSTTLFRAILNAGLPVTERHAHAYRVNYYEQDSGPGIDATVYVPSVDLKFKNTTGNYILITSAVDTTNLTMSFTLYGKKDGREVSITQPVILSSSPAPEPLYQDDPTLPVGVVKQIDYAAAGANVTFSRVVTQNGKEIINETYKSNYRPWQAVFLRGTKEG